MHRPVASRLSAVSEIEHSTGDASTPVAREMGQQTTEMQQASCALAG